MNFLNCEEINGILKGTDCTTTVSDTLNKFLSLIDQTTSVNNVGMYMLLGKSRSKKKIRWYFLQIFGDSVAVIFCSGLDLDRTDLNGNFTEEGFCCFRNSKVKNFMFCRCRNCSVHVSYVNVVFSHSFPAAPQALGKVTIVRKKMTITSPSAPWSSARNTFTKVKLKFSSLKN